MEEGEIPGALKTRRRRSGDMGGSVDY